MQVDPARSRTQESEEEGRMECNRAGDRLVYRTCSETWNTVTVEWDVVMVGTVEWDVVMVGTVEWDVVMVGTVEWDVVMVGTVEWDVVMVGTVE